MIESERNAMSKLNLDDDDDDLFLRDKLSPNTGN